VLDTAVRLLLASYGLQRDTYILYSHYPLYAQIPMYSSGAAMPSMRNNYSMLIPLQLVHVHPC
jgi:hypothetical protein